MELHKNNGEAQKLRPGFRRIRWMQRFSTWQTTPRKDVQPFEKSQNF